METTIREMNGAAIVRVPDELDLLGYQAITDKVDAILHSGQKKIVLDLSEVSYVNMAAVSALVRVRERARKAGGALAIACLKSGARAALEAGGATRALSVHASIEDAAAEVTR